MAAAGVTKPILYYYFQNKEGIYLELMRETHAKFNTLLNYYSGGDGSTIERLLHLSDQVFLLSMENIEFVRLIYSFHYGPPQGTSFFNFEDFHLKLHDMIKRLLEKGIQKGELLRKNSAEMT